MDGCLGNPKVRIPLPGYLEDASKLLGNFGQGQRIDELTTSITRAAEAAVRLMNVNDAKNIMTGGGETSANSFLRTRPAYS